MQHLDEGTIHAWLDGALSSDEAARTEAHVASCAVCADAVAEARGLIAASSRILTALDDIPGGVVLGARSVVRPRLWATWLVRERIAAVLVLVVAGGALAVAVSRDMMRSASVQTASEPVQTFELAAADSPLPPAVATATEARKDEQTNRGSSGRGAALPPSRDRDLAAVGRLDAPPPRVPGKLAPQVTAEVAAPPPVHTDDSVRSVVVAEAQREEAEGRSAAAKASVGEKFADVLPRARAADAPARRLAEPRALEQSLRGVVAGTGAAGDQRLVHDEQMIEGGRQVRRRIYTVDGILVTLDERLPSAADRVERRAQQANAVAAAPTAQGAPARADSTAETTNTIRWIDARGAELTLTGPASQARLERIRKLLGY